MPTQKFQGIVAGKSKQLPPRRMTDTRRRSRRSMTASRNSEAFVSDCPKTGGITSLPDSTMETSGGCVSPAMLAETHTFLPGLVENYLLRQELPMKQKLAVLFVDIADSTSTVLRQPPEVALMLVQHFMSLVTEIALAHDGDVKDYEGDGALLYFESVAEAARAALAIRAALTAERSNDGNPLQARFSLNVGEVIIGLIGAPQRRSVALIGPAVTLASRLLKHISPGGIIAPQTAIEELQKEAPDVARQFTLGGKCMVLRGFEEDCVTAYHIPAPVFS